MKALYNFVHAETGFNIGDLTGLELAVCPREGEIVSFAAGSIDEVMSYIVEFVSHTFQKNPDGEVTQIVDLSVSPVEARH